MIGCNQVAILAGGLGTRLGKLTEKTPKSLVPIANHPFLFYQLELLRQNSITKIALLLGRFGEMIESAVRQSPLFSEFEFQFVYDGAAPLGTAGSIKVALPLLDPVFFVMYGDSYLDINFATVAQKFLHEKRDGLMTVFRNEGKWDSSNVDYDGKEIIRYSKTDKGPNMKYIDYGLSLFRKDRFDHYVPNGPFDLSEVLQRMLAAGELSAFEAKTRFYEVGSLTGIQDFENYICNKPKHT